MQDKRALDIIQAAQVDDAVDERIGNALIALWKDPGIQATYDNQSKFQLNDSTKYFLDKVSFCRFILAGDEATHFSGR